MKKLLITIGILVVIGIIIVIYQNINMKSNNLQNSKIVAQESMSVMYNNLTFTAFNISNKPSEIITKQADKIIWQKELSSVEIDPNLEKDVQLLDYFVSKMKVDKFNSKEALFVTLGTGVKARTYVLNIETGDILDLIIISPFL